MRLFSILGEWWLFSRLFGNHHKYNNNNSRHQTILTDDFEYDCECDDRNSSLSSSYIHYYDCHEHDTYDYGDDFEDYECGGGFDDFEDF